MKKLVVIILCAAALSGCASFWNMMGAASVDSVKEVKMKVDELSALKAEIEGIRASAEEAKQSAAKVDEVSKSLTAIQSRLDLLPKETLQKLNDILDKALVEVILESQASTGAPLPDKPAGGK